MKRMMVFIMLLCLLCGLLGCNTLSKDTGEILHFTFKVTHADGTEKVFEIETQKATLADALLAENLVEESAVSAGLYTVVDGEEADWDDGEAWWCFSQDGVALSVGIEQTALTDGATYEAVFTRGFGETGE